jgi:23S rRNA (adenine2503-C2)-methyltransferase
MSSDTADSHFIRFFDCRPQSLGAIVRQWGWPAFRAKQICKWVYERLIVDPALMTNLAKSDRNMLAASMDFASGEVVRKQESDDGTKKVLITWADGKNAESVLIPEELRLTACLSSQVGCPARCRFCASGADGFQANLSAGQIVEQVFQINRLLEEGRRVNHIVMMGMGEPLANYANVIEALHILHDPLGFNIGARKITVSTVGIPDKTRQLAGEGLPVNLAISLHAPNEALRRELIPWAEHFKLDEILAAARYYFEKTGREITLEYILLAGVNDRPEHARQLVKLCGTLRANVNLIRYNEVEGLPYRRPDTQAVRGFEAILHKGGVNAHVRKSRGRDIDAACGQLRRRSQEADL